jgi:hypothetical protein
MPRTPHCCVRNSTKNSRVANTLATGVSENEITKVYASVAREVEVTAKPRPIKAMNSMHVI